VNLLFGGGKMATKQLAKVINGKVCLSTAAMTDTFCISQQTLSFWESNGCPKEARGWWSIRDVLEWKGVLGSLGVKSEEDNEKISWNQKKLQAEAKYKEQKAKEAEFKNAVNEGDYILKTDVVIQLEKFFVVLKRSMTSYSRRITTELSGYVDNTTARRIEKIITELTMDALEQLSIDGVYKASKKKS
jgi:hypothetical protein